MLPCLHDVHDGCKAGRQGFPGGIARVGQLNLAALRRFGLPARVAATKSLNTQSVAELLRGYFAWFVDAGFSGCAVSVRCGAVIPRMIVDDQMVQ